MIIDVHAHVFAFPKRKHPGTQTTFLSMEQQIAIMDAQGIDKAAILPLSSPENPAEFQSWGEILFICERYPGRFIPFCNLDPRLPLRPDLVTVDNFLEILTQFKELGFKGLGELTARIPWDDPALDKMFTACEQVELPITFHTTLPETNSYGLIDDMGLPRFEKVLQRHPALIFLGHSQAFWSEIGPNLTREDKVGYPQGPVKPGGRLPDLFRRYPTLNGDLSAWSGMNALTRDLDHAFAFLDEFQDRLCLGMDCCSAQHPLPHAAWFKEQLAKKNITPAVYEKITWQNTNRLLKLGL